MPLKLDKLINDFWESSEKNPELELYNEAGLQHELAFYLRGKLPQGYRVQLERNIYDVIDNPNNDVFVKKEMDIYIYKDDCSERYCIELKFPTNDAYPRRMYQTLTDVKFLEQLKNDAGFNQAALLFITNLTCFKMTKANNNHGIYKMFREEYCLKDLSYDNIPDFIKNKKSFKSFKIFGKYDFIWETFRKEYHFFNICF